MPSKKFSLGLTVVLAMFATSTLFTATPAAAQTDKLLHTFGGKNANGFQPWAGLAFDAAGNLYGTTTSGHGPVDISGGGTVFKLTPAAGGGWVEQVVHSFEDNGTDGYEPLSSVILDTAGNLYGTTQFGGPGICYLGGYYATCGTVYELKPNPGGGWTEEILHDFNTAGDGIEPWGGLIFDASGNLYGTTTSGGAYSYYGTVFELSPQPDGSWIETILHSFNSNGVDGWNPSSGLTFDAQGNLYGTTIAGGANDAGTVYELTPAAGGAWTESVLHSFADNGNDGYNPDAGVVLDAAGNLYGATVFGGPTNSSGNGIIFELSPQTGGSWTESIVHSFNGNQAGGGQPIGSLIIDASGNLYGTASVGGSHESGTVFELIQKANGSWTEKLFHNFTDTGGDGASPYGGLIFDSSGNLYGTTRSGGAHNGGTVFEITP
jgi:uncharacterized repeat protein (TIGR03803 family)